MTALAFLAVGVAAMPIVIVGMVAGLVALSSGRSN